jgi:hypothetical protein
MEGAKLVDMCNCRNVTVLKGDKGDVGPQGPQGIQGVPGANGTSQTETNLRAANAAFSTLVTQANSPVDDAELTLTVAVAGKYMVSYSGSVRISSNADLTASVGVIIRKKAVTFKNERYSYNNNGVAYEVNLEEWKPVTIFDTIDLLIGDVVDIRYERAINPAPNVNSTMIARGSLNLIKIAN